MTIMLLTTIVIVSFVVNVNNMMIDASSSSSSAMMMTTATTRRRRRKRNVDNNSSNNAYHTSKLQQQQRRYHRELSHVDNYYERILQGFINSMSMMSSSSYSTTEASQSDIITPSSSTTSIDNNDNQQQQQSTTLYNKRIKLCPGYEEMGIYGYLNLEDLQFDLMDYYTTVAAATTVNNISSDNIPSVTPITTINSESGSPSPASATTFFEEEGGGDDEAQAQSSGGPTVDILEPVSLPDYSSPDIAAADEEGGNSTVLTNTTTATDNDDASNNNNTNSEEGLDPNDNNINNNTTTTTATGEDEGMSVSEGLPYVDENGTVADEGVEGGVLYPPDTNLTTTTVDDAEGIDEMGTDGWSDNNSNSSEAGLLTSEEGLISESAPGYEMIQTVNDDGGGEVSIMGGQTAVDEGGSGTNTLDVYANDRRRRLSTLRHRNLQEVGGMEGNSTDSEIITEDNGLVDEVESEQGSARTSSSDGEEAGGSSSASSGVGAAVAGGGENATTAGVEEGENDQGESTSAMSNSTTTITTTTTASEETTPMVSFPICPKSTLTYPPPSTAVGVTIEPEPIVLHTPSIYNPISIYCTTALIVNGEEGGKPQGVDTRSCSMIGGDVHLLFRHTTTETQGESDHHPITISGITFNKAKSSSIKMLEPRGDITFANCGWENNGGIDDQDQSSSEATILIDGRHNAGSVSFSSSSEEGSISSTENETIADAPNSGTGRRHRDRNLQNEGDVAAPRQSTITIDDSTFSGNTGSTIIQVIDNGNAEEGELSSAQQVVQLSIKDTTFTSSNADTSVITNDGGHVQVTDVNFANNTAQSIISSDNNGIVSMTNTQFEDNDIQGNEGVVVLDNAEALEMNSGNCGNSNNNGTTGTTTTLLPESPVDNSAGEMQGDGGIITPEEEEGASTRLLQQQEHCNGISSNGVCNAFVSCDDSAVVSLTGPEFGQEPPPCYSNWDILVTAVKERPNGIRNFIICPGAVLSVTSSPVVIDSDYIIIQCGTAEEPARNCTINGGHSQFDIVGSSSGVELARLSMSHSTGSSIRAFGSSDATLNLRDCEWIYNKGASVILIHDNEAFNVSPSLPPAGNGSETKTLDIKDLLLQPTLVGSAMSVEVTNCTFGTNDLTFGAIANVGGTLKVYKSHFLLNSGEGGDIVVTNSGSSNVQSSCFSNSSSVAPGIIFIEDGSKMSGSGNFGAVSNTAGSYKSNGADQSCTHVFQEAEGSNCLGVSTTGSCTGSCLAFTTTSCPLDEISSMNIGVPTAAPKDEILVSAASRKEEGGSSKIIPIVVAAVVCAFIVFGFIGIIMRRRKVSSSEGASRSGGGGGKRCCCKRGGANEDIELQEQDEFD